MQIIQIHRRGFTLIEIILAVLIIGIVGSLVGPMMITGVKSYDLVYHRKSALSQARLAMERMVSEIRLIRSTSDITAWTASNLQFSIPTQSNISYSLNTTNLMRGPAILADNVVLLQFSYLNANGQPTATQADIKRIGIEMSLSAGAGRGNIKERTQVFLRGVTSPYSGFE